MPFPDGTWRATVKDGVVTAQYLTLDQRVYTITPHELFKSFLLEEIRLTMNGSSTLFPSESDPGWRTGLIKAKEDTARVRENANTNARMIYQLGKTEKTVRYIPTTLLAPEVKHTDTLDNGSKATWIPVLIPNAGLTIQGWCRADVVDVVATSEDDKPAAPAIPVEPTPETLITPPALVPSPAPEPPSIDLRQDLEALDIIIRQLEDELSEINHQLVKIDSRLRLLQNIRKDIAKLVSPEPHKEIA